MNIVSLEVHGRLIIASQFLLTFKGDGNTVGSLQNSESLSSIYELPGVDSLMVEVLTITSKSKKIRWKQSGLTLNIPEHAVVKHGHSKYRDFSAAPVFIK